MEWVATSTSSKEVDKIISNSSSNNRSLNPNKGSNNKMSNKKKKIIRQRLKQIKN